MARRLDARSKAGSALPAPSVEVTYAEVDDPATADRVVEVFRRLLARAQARLTADHFPPTLKRPMHRSSGSARSAASQKSQKSVCRSSATSRKPIVTKDCRGPFRLLTMRSEGSCEAAT